MERCQGSALLDSVLNPLVYDAALGEIFSTMHNSVAYSLYLVQRTENSVLRVNQQSEYILYTLCMVSDRFVDLVFVLSRNRVCNIALFHSDSLYQTLGKQRMFTFAPHIQHLVLD